MMGSMARSTEPPQGILYRGRKLSTSATAIITAPSVSIRTRVWELVVMDITSEKEYTALQSVQVQCGMLLLRHMCIFPYDGTNRIRFTGQGCVSPISAGCIRPPEDLGSSDSIGKS